MPIEIRELVIKATIDESGAQESTATTPGAIDREEIIADCVEQILQILREQMER